MRRARGLPQHRDEGCRGFKEGAAFFVAISACGTMQDRASDFQCAVNRRGSNALSEPCFDERPERLVVDSANFEITDGTKKHLNVPGDGRSTALVLRLEQKALRTVGEEPACVLALFERKFKAIDLSKKPTLGIPNSEPVAVER
jgi:hypothetical protein